MFFGFLVSQFFSGHHRPPIFVPNGIEKVFTIMMFLLAWSTGQWKEGVARLELPCVRNFDSERSIMINNSSFDKWKRLDLEYTIWVVMSANIVFCDDR
jgi:hypothetical protein